MAPNSRKSPSSRAFGCLWRGLKILALILAIIVVFGLLSLFIERLRFKQSGLIQDCRTIQLCLFEYAQDHDDKYPDGKTSTEIFQKLIDGGYVSNPAHQDEAADQNLFYFPMPGKMKPSSGKLKPENVCWDVTGGLDIHSPDGTPVVYLSGYKIDFSSGVATPRRWPLRGWWQWLRDCDFPRGYIVAGYRNNTELLLKADLNGVIPDFVHSDARTENFHQITPDGTLP